MSEETAEKASQTPSWAPYFLFWIVAAYFVVLGLNAAFHTLSATLLRHTVVWQWDEWDELRKLIRFMDGKVPLWDYLTMTHNEHRVGMSRVATLIDVGLFRGETAFPKMAMIVAWISLLGAFVIALWRDNAISLSARILSTSLLLIIFFAAQHLENFIRAFNAQVVFVVAFPAFALLLVRAAEGARQAGKRSISLACFVGALLCGIAGEYSMANGLIAWPIYFVYAAFLRTPKARLFALALVAAIFIALYLHGFTRPVDAPIRPVTGLGDLWALVQFFFTLLGAPAGSDYATWFGAAICGLCVYWCARLAQTRPLRLSSAWLLVAIALLALATSGLVAIGRSFLSLDQALAARYTTYTAPLFAALIVIGAHFAMRANTNKKPALRVADIVAFAMLALILIPVHDNQSGMQGWARGQQRQYDLARAAMLAGAPDATFLVGAYPAPETLQPEIDDLRARHWSVFGDSDQRRLSEMIQNERGAPLTKKFALHGDWCAGAIGRSEPVTLTTGAAGPWSRAEGWAYDRARKRPINGVIVADAQDKLIGYGQIVPFSEKREIAPDGATAPFAFNFFAFAPVAPDAALRAYAYSKRQKSLCRLST